MLPYLTSLFLVLSALAISLNDGSLRPIETGKSRAGALVDSMVLYHDALTTFAIANPGVTGSVSTASLSLPTWYVNPGFANSIQASGVVRTWLAPGATGWPEQSAYVLALTHRLQGYANVGVVNATGFYSPVTGQVSDLSSIAAIPPKSVFIFTKVR